MGWQLEWEVKSRGDTFCKMGSITCVYAEWE